MTDNESLRDYLEQMHRMACQNEASCREEVAALLNKQRVLFGEIKVYQQHKEQLYEALKLMEAQEIASVVNPADDCTCHGGTRPCDCI